MLGSGFSLQAAFWYQKAMLALLPQGGESLTPRQKAGNFFMQPMSKSEILDKFL